MTAKASGWAHMDNSRRWHFFGAVGGSLCGRWAFFGEVRDAAPSANADTCSACMAKIRAERARKGLDAHDRNVEAERTARA